MARTIAKQRAAVEGMQGSGPIKLRNRRESSKPAGREMPVTSLASRVRSNELNATGTSSRGC